MFSTLYTVPYDVAKVILRVLHIEQELQDYTLRVRWDDVSLNNEHSVWDFLSLVFLYHGRCVRERYVPSCGGGGGRKFGGV